MPEIPTAPESRGFHAFSIFLRLREVYKYRRQEQNRVKNGTTPATFGTSCAIRGTPRLQIVLG